ncbi:hypothetical protein [Streptomyces sp. NPDC088554]|uniref:hypothetical protein n=1 Tax=Streptomyces sp. NPDC088554 TaxID=3365865 RepID=UPI0037FD75E0
MSERIDADRLEEIRQLRFTVDGHHPTRMFATPAEQQLYQLAATLYGALRDVLDDHQHLTGAHTAATNELARWTGVLSR